MKRVKLTNKEKRAMRLRHWPLLRHKGIYLMLHGV